MRLAGADTQADILEGGMVWSLGIPQLDMIPVKRLVFSSVPCKVQLEHLQDYVPDSPILVVLSNPVRSVAGRVLGLPLQPYL
jgi:hypothetical protein